MKQLDYARVKLLAHARRDGERLPSPGPSGRHGRHWVGWRTEWPEEFPVTVTRAAGAVPPAEPDPAEAA